MSEPDGTVEAVPGYCPWGYSERRGGKCRDQARSSSKSSERRNTWGRCYCLTLLEGTDREVCP